jgi:hypothetical protein
MLVSCTGEKEVLLSKIDIMIMVYKGDKNASLVKPLDMNAGIKCEDYSEGCKGGHTGDIKSLHMIFLHYKSTELAKKCAIKINGYYYKNWVFDDVKGEPDLEKFIKKYLNAIDAREEALIEDNKKFKTKK